MKNNRKTRTSYFKRFIKQKSPNRRSFIFHRFKNHITIISKRQTEKKTCYTKKPMRLYNWNQPIRHIENYTLIVIQHKLIQNEDNSENSVLPFLISLLSEPRGKLKFRKNLIANLFEKGESPCTREFLDVKIKRQLLDHYIEGICSLTSHFGIHIIEIISPNASHNRYLIQIDDDDIEF